MIKINEIKTRNEVAEILNIPVQKLTYVLYICGVDNYYKSFDIPKKNGETRRINAPTGYLKQIQKKLAKILEDYQMELLSEKKMQTKVSHAFEKNKGIMTNARVHRNKRYVLNLDIENYFEQFHFGRVKGFFEKNRNFNLPKEVAIIIAQLTCFNGSLPQGAPTSPIITNLICNILDMRITKIAQKYKVNYTRYADDITFSTNKKTFLKEYDIFYNEINDEINNFGFNINEKKTRLSFKDSRQEVTGLIVNEKIGVFRNFYKQTRAMADSLYRDGEFKINGEKGTITQLEGRFAFINQIDRYNNQIDGKKHAYNYLNTREKQYRNFLFYKYFYKNHMPFIVTEGKTDIVYLKSALKKYYEDYPKLIIKKDDSFQFLVSFMTRTPRFEYFFKIEQDGADTIKNIYNHYAGKNNFPNLREYFEDKYDIKPSEPVILIFDNEQGKKKPLGEFKHHTGINNDFTQNRYEKIISNLYVMTHDLINGRTENEIEDLFDNETLETVINGKKFERSGKGDINKYYNKSIFSQYIAKNYKKIDFSGFKSMLDDINTIIEEYRNN